MSQLDEIYEKLKKRRYEGMTQTEMSKASGVSQSYICKVLAKRAGIGRLGIGVFFKLFPTARIVFEDDKAPQAVATIQHSTNSQVIQGDGNFVAGNHCKETAEEFMDRIMASEDIDAAMKVTIYKVYKSCQD